jgi:hypothetical protein
VTCPRCKLTNPGTAQRCDCGYDFETKTVEKPYFTSGPREIGGWLALLIFQLTVGSPIYTVIYLVNRIKQSGPTSAIDSGMVINLLLISFGVYAGICLQRVKPKAVRIAKRYLLAHFFVFAVLVVIFGILGVYQTNDVALEIYSLIPFLIISLIWYSYLNKSKRVARIYAVHAGPKVENSGRKVAVGQTDSRPHFAPTTNAASPHTMPDANLVHIIEKVTLKRGAVFTVIALIVGAIITLSLYRSSPHSLDSGPTGLSGIKIDPTPIVSLPAAEPVPLGTKLIPLYPPPVQVCLRRFTGLGIALDKEVQNRCVINPSLVPVAILSPTGERGWVPKNRLKEALQAGGKIDPEPEAGTKRDNKALVACRRVTITRLLASKLSWVLAVKSCSRNNSIPI